MDGQIMHGNRTKSRNEGQIFEIHYKELKMEIDGLKECLKGMARPHDHLSWSQVGPVGFNEKLMK